MVISELALQREAGRNSFQHTVRHCDARRYFMRTSSACVMVQPLFMADLNRRRRVKDIKLYGRERKEGKLIGRKAFEKRLNTFFDNGYYDVGNEPDFLTSCLYDWIGRPDLSSQQTREIIEKNYSAKRNGLPGNDDSGAMSSWLAFHMMGIYPNAGQPYYLITSPFIKRTILHLANGAQFQIDAKHLSGKNVYIQSATLDGKPFDRAWIYHKDIVRGGTLVLNMGPQPSKWGEKMLPPIFK